MGWGALGGASPGPCPCRSPQAVRTEPISQLKPPVKSQARTAATRKRMAARRRSWPPRDGLRFMALGWWVLLPSASGAQVNGLQPPLRITPHRPAQRAGAGSWARATLLPAARSARPPAPRHLKMPRGDSSRFAPSKAAPAEQKPHHRTPQPTPSRRHDAATRHQDRASHQAGIP